MCSPSVLPVYLLNACNVAYIRESEVQSSTTTPPLTRAFHGTRQRIILRRTSCMDLLIPSQGMRGSTLFRILLLAGLCCRVALQPAPSLSLFRHSDNFLHFNPYQQIRELGRASSVCSYVIFCTVPTASGLWLPAAMRKHNYAIRKGMTHTAVSRKDLSPPGTRFQMEIGTAWETRKNGGNTASQRVRRVHVDYRLYTLGDGDTANASTRNTQEDFGQSQDCGASSMQSSIQKGVEVGLQGPSPKDFVGMLIRQLEGTTSASDALKVAFSKRCNRVSFRDRVLSNLRQNAIVTGLGVTDDFKQNEEFIFPDLCSDVSSGKVQPSKEETVTREGEEETQERSDRTAVACLEKKTLHRPTATGRDCRVASRGCRKPPLPPMYSHTVEGTGTPSCSGANSTHASNALKTTGAAHAHAETSSQHVRDGSEHHHVLKGFQLLPPERRSASRYPVRGKLLLSNLPRRRNRKRTASDSLRHELGLHHRSDILVQHITDLRCPLRLPRRPRTVRRKKFACSRA